MKNVVKEYKEDGFCIFKSVLDINTCNELKNYLSTLKVKRWIPFSNIPWGWGSLIGKGPFDKVINNKILNGFFETLFGNKKYIFPNMMINNKAPWIGLDVEWHREIFNVDTYAPGYSFKDWENLARIYIALDDQTKENGCLQLYSKSHTVDKLPYEDIIDCNFGHKRRVTSEGMNLVSKTCKHIYCEMDFGDMLIFNDRIVHGSNTNKTSHERKSIVLGVRNDIKKSDKNIYEKATSFRRQFIIDNLEKRINEIKTENMYNDFNKEK